MAVRRLFAEQQPERMDEVDLQRSTVEPVSNQSSSHGKVVAVARVDFVTYCGHFGGVRVFLRLCFGEEGAFVKSGSGNDQSGKRLLVRDEVMLCAD